MPMLIDSPESWFRREQRDLYFLSHSERRKAHELKPRALAALKKRYPSQVQAIESWLKIHLPAHRLMTIGPSEYSGWIMGGPSELALDLDAESVAKFMAAWVGYRSPWTLRTQHFSEWNERIMETTVVDPPLPQPRYLRWWDTPEGFLFLTGRDAERQISFGDADWRIRKLHGERFGERIQPFPCGEFYPGDDRYGPTIVIEWGDYREDSWRGTEYEENETRLLALRQALGLNPTQRVRVAVGD